LELPDDFLGGEEFLEEGLLLDLLGGLFLVF